MDSYAIASALATRLGTVTAPSGQESIKQYSAELPDELALLPALFVMPPSMEGPTYAGSKRTLPLTYPVGLYLARADGLPRRAHALHDWITAIYGRLAGQMALGLASYVAWSEVMSWTPGVSYAGVDYDGLRLEVMVNVNEGYVPAQ